MHVGGLKPLRPFLTDYVPDIQRGDPDVRRYWGRLKQVCVFQEQGNITSLDFLPHSPYQLASTSRNRLTIFDSTAMESLCFHSRFKSPLYSATYREDGSLLGVSTHDGHVHFFDVTPTSKRRVRLENPIRSYHAHKCRINSIAYSPSKLSFVSMADDGRIKLWNLGESESEKTLWKCHGHRDQVRDGKFGESNENLLVTGSYDHTVKVWDTRTKANSSHLTLQHHAPVEKLLVLNNDRIVVTASKSIITIWDLTAGGKTVNTLKDHHKTVTSLCLASGKTILLSGGLDRRINGFRLDNGEYDLVYSLKTASPVLALSISADDNLMAYGMSNLLAVHKRMMTPEADIREKATTDLMNGKTDELGYKFHTAKREVPLYIANANPRRISAPPAVQSERSTDWRKAPEPKIVELTARQLNMMPLGQLDYLLKNRMYRQLTRTIVRNPELVEKRPEIAVSAIQQLVARQKLYTALSGHSNEDLVLIIRFLRLNLFKAPFFDLLYQATDVLLTIYAEEEVSSEAIDEIGALKRDLQSEIQLQMSVGKSLGAMNTILAASIDLSRQSRTSRAVDVHEPEYDERNGVEEVPHITNGYKSTASSGD